MDALGSQERHGLRVAMWVGTLWALFSLGFPSPSSIYKCWYCNGGQEVKPLGEGLGWACGCVGGTSLAAQWLGLRASTAGGAGSIPAQGTKILHVSWQKKKKKKEKGSTWSVSPPNPGQFLDPPS